MAIIDRSSEGDMLVCMMMIEDINGDTVNAVVVSDPISISGKSAYQYAVDGGYTGTEEEFRTLMGTGPWLPLSGGTLTGDLTLSDKNLRLKYQNRIVTIKPTNLVSSGITRFVLNIGEVYNSNLTRTIPIYGVGTPELKNDAANKQYVDDLVGDIASILDSINGEVA